jgi:hypothetical protein
MRIHQCTERTYGDLFLSIGDIGLLRVLKKWRKILDIETPRPSVVDISSKQKE